MKFLKKEKSSETQLQHTQRSGAYAAFTLAELIVAVLIGSLVLSILMGFITTSMNEITYSNKQTEIIEKINSLSTTMDNYKGTFAETSVLIDKSGTGSDIIMMTNPELSEGILMGVVDEKTLMLEDGESDFNMIYEKYIGTRQLTAADIALLNTTPNSVYSLNFNSDKLLRGLIMKDFQAVAYNTGAVIDADLSILINYKDSVDGENWDNITNDWIYKINMNF